MLYDGIILVHNSVKSDQLIYDAVSHLHSLCYEKNSKPHTQSKEIFTHLLSSPWKQCKNNILNTNRINFSATFTGLSTHPNKPIPATVPFMIIRAENSSA